jgi:hypothetical protein
VKSITSTPPSNMSTLFIRSLISRIPVRPTPLFQDNIDSTDSAGSDDDVPVIEETMPTQGPEASGENLIPSIGLLDPEGYVGTVGRGAEGRKGMSLWIVTRKRLTNFSSISDFRWHTTQTFHLGSSGTKAQRRRVAGVTEP